MSNREPLALRAAIVAAISSGLSLLVAFGIGWTPEQAAAIMACVNAVSIAVVVVWSRGSITPVADPRDAQGAPLVPEATDDY